MLAVPTRLRLQIVGPVGSGPTPTRWAQNLDIDFTRFQFLNVGLLGLLAQEVVLGAPDEDVDLLKVQAVAVLLAKDFELVADGSLALDA